ncbi:hypothetical protein [Saccharomonospora sp. NB11]|uniref:hypothetical protein n=1 Tax=Saccharomonospora sp. NB11 TaxID=1642298 RepID=UPI001E5589F1|nr:hypothetical protein [Saccharomonospora sp. NB11]
MAVLHAAAAVAAAKFAVFQPTDRTLVTVIALALLVGTVALWSAIDAWTGLSEAGRTWFIAALVAGVGAGVLTVLGKAVFVDRTGVSALASALTGGAAFTALLVLVPAGLGLLVGGRLRARYHNTDSAEDDEDGPRKPSPRPRPRREAEPAH